MDKTQMKGACHHMGLFSRRPQKLIQFYTDKLGFELADTKQISRDWMEKIFGLEASCSLTKLKLGKIVLEVFSSSGMELETGKSPLTGYNHWGMEVEDKETFVQNLEKKGVYVLKLGTEGRFIYFIKDPEGNLIEICEAKG